MDPEEKTVEEQSSKPNKLFVAGFVAMLIILLAIAAFMFFTPRGAVEDSETVEPTATPGDVEVLGQTATPEASASTSASPTGTPTISPTQTPAPTATDTPTSTPAPTATFGLTNPTPKPDPPKPSSFPLSPN